MICTDASIAPGDDTPCTTHAKTKAQLIDELETLRQRVAALEARGLAEAQASRNSKSNFMLEVIEAMADGLILMDPDGRFVFVNRAMEKMSGYERDELWESTMKSSCERDHRGGTPRESAGP